MRSAYPRRPALDGIRGIYMAGFMAFHFGATFLSGMWLAINIFFVLSGFLITRLLVEERSVWGHIDVIGFYRRRARRLLPGLTLMLVVVTAYAALLAPSIERRRFGGDILSALGFIMNWRLIAQDDDYFGEQGVASPVRHAWTLSIEEQYYVVIPLVVICLYGLLRRKVTRVVALLAAAGAAAWWTAGLAEGVGPSQFARLYYGTDTRVSCLLLGSALGFALGARRGRIPRLSPATLAVIGWAGFIATSIAFVLVPPTAPWIYTSGGALVLALAAAGMIASAADGRDSLLQRVLGWRPFAWFGRLSYSLYLWHWPVAVALQQHPVSGSAAVNGALGFLLSVGLAVVSDRFFESPVLRGGVSALLPRLRRPLPLALAPMLAVALVSGTVLLPSATNAQLGSTATTLADAPELVPGQAAYRDGQPAAVAVLGDSVPWYLANRFPQRLFPGTKVVNLAHEGCDLIDLPMATAFGVKTQEKLCDETRRTWPDKLRSSGAEVVLIFGSPLLAVPHVMPDGSTGRIGQPAYDGRVRSALDELDTKARAHGAKHVMVVTVPCRRFIPARGEEELKALRARTPEYLAEYDEPTRINTLLTEWAKARKDVQVIDLHGATCPSGYRPSVGGIQLFNDGLHFSPEASPMVWRWLLGRMQNSMSSDS